MNTESVTRWKLDACGNMTTEPDGEWVTYEDYESMRLAYVCAEQDVLGKFDKACFEVLDPVQVERLFKKISELNAPDKPEESSIII